MAKSPKPQIGPDAVWTDLRCDQFEKFELLLHECSSVDSANRIIDRLRRIEMLAEELDDFASSFRQFLRQVLLHDRFPDKCEMPVTLTKKQARRLLK
jgi:hypothetical protein